MKVKIDATEVQKRLNKYHKDFVDASRTVVQLTATQIVVHSKHTAPWRDRTGNARRSIHKESQNNNLKANIGIGMPYGKYLELSRGGRYRTIEPSVFGYGKVELLKNLKGIMPGDR